MKERKYAKFIWAGIVLAVLFMVWPYKKDEPLPIDVKQEVHKADSIRATIDTRKDTREQIDQKISDLQILQDSILTLRAIIKTYKIQIKQYNEKANNVPKLSTDELVQFLAVRYKDSTITK